MKLDKPTSQTAIVGNPYLNAAVDLATEVLPMIPLIALISIGAGRSEQQKPTSEQARAIRTLTAEELKAERQSVEGTYVRTTGFPADRLVLGVCDPVLYRIPVGFEDVQYTLRAEDSTLLGTFRRQEYRSVDGKVVPLKPDAAITCDVLVGKKRN